MLQRSRECESDNAVSVWLCQCGLEADDSCALASFVLGMNFPSGEFDCLIQVVCTSLVARGEGPVVISVLLSIL